MRRLLTVLLAVAFAGSLGLAGSGEASARSLAARPVPSAGGGRAGGAVR